ncbi:VOC family protein [Kocuria sp. CPCC 205292]|uniref:VOC family protein n=1 Tax=Kocuria cellulosilytica TaxID=3071451 RepID=UPI0034D79E36
MSTEQNLRGVTGAHTTDGTPHGFTSLTPFIAVVDAAAAIDFCTRAFGAVLVDRTDMPGADGTPVVVHATLDLGAGRLQLGEVNPDFHLVPPPAGDDDCCSLGLYVPDVDAVVARAVAAGATVREPVSTFVSGDRFGSIRDPFGVRWSVMTRVEDLSPEQSSARVAEWAESAGQA